MRPLKPHDDALHQRLAGAAIGLSAAAHGDPSHGPADLDADRAVSMRDDPLERRVIDGPGIDIEATRALAERLDGGVNLQLIDRPEN
jgi:hypothetical protein